jgi:cell division protein FtsX
LLGRYLKEEWQQMAKKERKGKKEKPLDRMTAKELREMALGMEGIVGVHAMNKSELVAAIKEARGIEEEKKRDKSVDVRSIKKKIRELRSQKETLREAGEKDKVQMLRKRISRLKKKTRRATKAA